MKSSATRHFPPAAAGILTITAACLLAAACSANPVDLFADWSTPDQRFEASRATADPVWTGPVPAGPFSFSFITDCHIVDGATPRLDRLIPALAGDSFLLMGGDLTQDGQTKDWQAFADWRGRAGLPVYAAIGNHDLYFRGWYHMPPALHQTSWSMSIGPGFRLIILDSGNATLGRQQYQWLQGVLAAATEAAIVVVSHHPLFDAGFGQFNSTDPEENAALMELFARRNVGLALYGHTHQAARREFGGTQHVVGESSRQLDGARDVIRVTVDAGKFTVSTYPLP
jgi:3',5'-cyclic AMP phosphodiesterase CpdA